MRLFLRFGIVALWIACFFAFLTAAHYLRPINDDCPTLHVFSWPETLSAKTIQKFEQKTGIKIVRHYYTSNEELLVKLKVSQGKGYDIIIPSDYAVKKMIVDDLLLPLDHSKFNFLHSINPKLVNHPFDPQNTYSIPYVWEILGFGINTDDFENLPKQISWQAVYEPSPGRKISMVNDPIEAIDFTARYLYGEKKALTSLDVEHLQKTLQKQKKFVEAYAGIRGDYLLATKNCSIAVIHASYVFRSAKNYKHIDFVLPEEHTFLSIENICIPKNSENTEAAYAFINYLYEPENFAREYETFAILPATTNVTPFIKAPPAYLRTLNSLENYTGKLYFTRELLPESQCRILWVNLKAL